MRDEDIHHWRLLKQKLGELGRASRLLNVDNCRDNLGRYCKKILESTPKRYPGTVFLRSHANDFPVQETAPDTFCRGNHSHAC